MCTKLHMKIGVHIDDRDRQEVGMKSLLHDYLSPAWPIFVAPVNAVCSNFQPLRRPQANQYVLRNLMIGVNRVRL